MIPGLFLLLVQCNTPKRPPKPLHYIAIQPIGSVNEHQLDFIRQQVDSFFHTPVLILPDQPMPLSFQNRSKGERYCADSLLVWLSHRKPDSVSIVLGFTSKDIYTANKDHYGHIKAPAAKYAVWGIFGLGYTPGAACIVSDYRFKRKAPELYPHRLRTIVIHEIGHNLGLRHCPNPHCIMNDANETIASVDSSGNTYCDSCTRIIRKFL
jgi:archaemetzincin